MKGPRKREASQPAANPNLRPPAEKGKVMESIPMLLSPLCTAINFVEQWVQK